MWNNSLPVNRVILLFKDQKIHTYIHTTRHSAVLLGLCNDKRTVHTNCREMAVFCDVAPRSLVEVYQRFRGPWCLHNQSDSSERWSTSEPSLKFYQTTRRYNPEDSHLRTHRRENLKSYLTVGNFECSKRLVLLIACWLQVLESQRVGSTHYRQFFISFSVISLKQGYRPMVPFCSCV
jgi:hypothetical protein